MLNRDKHLKFIKNRLIIKNIVHYQHHGDVLDLTGCFGENRLRVRALFPVINEQNKLNAKDNVIEADFSKAYALAA